MDMGMNVDTAITLLRRIGAQPVLLRPRSKAPVEPAWEQRTWNEDDIRATFTDTHNLGLRCGDNNLVDVDPDSPEAIIAARVFLPETAMRHGRHTDANNHRWYRTDATMPTAKFTDPMKPLPKGMKSMLVEVRSVGAQTMIPPSIHPDTGTALAWGVPLELAEPAEVPATVLHSAAARTAACALVARYWPAEGGRHDFALALAGMLLRHGWDRDGAVTFVQTAGRIAGDEETMSDRTRAVEDTRAALVKGERVTGIPTVKRYLPEPVVEKVCEWLGIEGKDDPAASRIEVVLHSEKRLIAPWQEILDRVEIDTDLLPHYLARLVAFVRPKMIMWPIDWQVSASLAFWSALWPRTRIENLNLAIWVLGIGRQGSGKNLGPDDLARLIREVGHELVWFNLDGEVRLRHFNSGSPQGLLDLIDGDGVPLMWYMREFGGMLQSFRRSEFMAGMRESLCNVYDGEPDSFARAHGKGSNPTNTHLAAFVTTNKTAILQHTTLEDLTGGLMSRFLVLASDYVEAVPDRFSVDVDVARGLKADLVRHVNQYRNVRRVVWEGGVEPKCLREFALEVGVGTGEVRNLDDDDEDIDRGPAGRLHAQAKKIAALLELAEHTPLLRDDETVVVRECNAELAVAIVMRHYAYGMRMRSWSVISQDTQRADRILRYLRGKPNPQSMRQVLQGTHLLIKEAEPAMRLLVQDGKVTTTTAEGKELFMAGGQR